MPSKLEQIVSEMDLRSMEWDHSYVRCLWRDNIDNYGGCGSDDDNDLK